MSESKLVRKLSEQAAARIAELLDPEQLATLGRGGRIPSTTLRYNVRRAKKSSTGIIAAVFAPVLEGLERSDKAIRTAIHMASYDETPMEPSPCGVEGHRKVDWIAEVKVMDGYDPAYCAACAREKAVEEAAWVDFKKKALAIADDVYNDRLTGSLEESFALMDAPKHGALARALVEARIEEAKRSDHASNCLMFNADRTVTGLDCSCRRGKRIAELKKELEAALGK